MIKYLKIEITPTTFARTDSDLRELKIQIHDSRLGEFGRTQILEPDELVSHFDQIWSCAGKELLHCLKESKDKTDAIVPLQVPESPVE